MRKVLSFAILAVAFLAIAGTAQATDFATTSVTFTDFVGDVNPSQNYDTIVAGGANDPYNYTHNINDNGYNLLTDTISSASILIDLDDDSDGSGENTDIYLDGVRPSNANDHNAATDYSYNFSSPFTSLLDGSLNVSVNPDSDGGDFRFDDSTLTVNVSRAVQAMLVDLELALLVDVSGSISTGSTGEFNVQKQGYVNAFQSLTDSQINAAGPLGKIAVSLTYWSSDNQQSQAVDWFLIDTEADADAFAALINATTRPFSGSTSISEALDFIDDDIIANGFDGTRLVVDISSDGQNNDPNSNLSTMTNARNAALAKLALGSSSYAINGLVFTSEFPNLATYFTNNVIGGTGVLGTDYFVLSVDDINDFGSALQTKIVREIGPEPGIPEPSSMALLGLGLLSGLARLRRKRA